MHNVYSYVAKWWSLFAGRAQDVCVLWAEGQHDVLSVPPAGLLQQAVPAAGLEEAQADLQPDTMTPSALLSSNSDNHHELLFTQP